MITKLAAREIVAGYHGGPPILNKVSLEIYQGQRLVLLGANGSGKTTLLKCLSGALAIESGVIETKGGPLKRTHKGLIAHRQRVQLVLQDPDDQLFAGEVLSDVAFGPTNLGLTSAEAISRAKEACLKLGISELVDHPIHQLSYGQRKRVAIAGAVAMQPEVLLLDEPTAGLDPAGVLAMRNTLDALELAGTTVVLSTHDVSLAWEWANQVGIVGDNTVLVGEATDMLTNPQLLLSSALEVPWPVELFTNLGVIPNSWPRTPLQVAKVLQTIFN